MGRGAELIIYRGVNDAVHTLTNSPLYGCITADGGLDGRKLRAV